jgi:SAD/SRA domain
LYRRMQLKEMGAFQRSQCGISGCSKFGADAIIVSGMREGYDNGRDLLYVAEWRIGANAMYKSYLLGYNIRVFRSTKYERGVAPNKMAVAASAQFCTAKSNTSYYRYGGLYRIVRVEPPLNCTGTFRFYMVHSDHADHAHGHQSPNYGTLSASLRAHWAQDLDEKRVVAAGHLLLLLSTGITNMDILTNCAVVECDSAHAGDERMQSLTLAATAATSLTKLQEEKSFQTDVSMHNDGNLAMAAVEEREFDDSYCDNATTSKSFGKRPRVRLWTDGDSTVFVKDEEIPVSKRTRSTYQLNWDFLRRHVQWQQRQQERQDVVNKKPKTMSSISSIETMNGTSRNAVKKESYKATATPRAALARATSGLASCVTTADKCNENDIHQPQQSIKRHHQPFCSATTLSSPSLHTKSKQKRPLVPDDLWTPHLKSRRLRRMQQSKRNVRWRALGGFDDRGVQHVASIR